MMLTASVPNIAGSARAAELTPIVFVVDDDISVRNSLEWLIRFEGWKAETFSSAQEFLARPRVFAPNCLVLDVSLPGSADLTSRNVSVTIGAKCQSSSSRAMAISPLPCGL